MKQINWIVSVTLLIVGLGLGNASAGEQMDGNINFLVGQKYLDAADWEPVDQQTSAGLMFDIKPKSWPIYLAADILASNESESISLGYAGYVYPGEVEGKTQEIDLGFRWYTPPNFINVYVGGGLALVKGELEISSPAIYGTASDSDQTTGLWFNTGVVFTITRHLNLGLDVRYSRAEIELNGIKGEAGGLNMAALIGYRF